MFEKRENCKKISNGGVLDEIRIQETDRAYWISAKLPGFQKDDVRIDLLSGVLTIQAGSNGRSFFLSDYLRPQDMAVSFEKGVLFITIPFARSIDEKSVSI